MRNPTLSSKMSCSLCGQNGDVKRLSTPFNEAWGRGNCYERGILLASMYQVSQKGVGECGSYFGHSSCGLGQIYSLLGLGLIMSVMHKQQ
jgi:hypothetical protein